MLRVSAISDLLYSVAFPQPVQLTIIFDLVVAIEVGMLAAVIFFMKRMSDEDFRELMLQQYQEVKDGIY